VLRYVHRVGTMDPIIVLVVVVVIAVVVGLAFAITRRH
jgi:hypothetical protein